MRSAAAARLALGCHIRLASENAVLGLPEVKLGIIPGYGGTQRLPRLVGQGRALELILTARNVKADEAERIGLVNRVVPQDQLLDEAVKLAETILKNGPVAVENAIESVVRGMSLPLEQGLRFESGRFGMLASTDDMHEGHAGLPRQAPGEVRTQVGGPAARGRLWRCPVAEDRADHPRFTQGGVMRRVLPAIILPMSLSLVLGTLVGLRAADGPQAGRAAHARAGVPGLDDVLPDDLVRLPAFGGHSLDATRVVHGVVTGVGFLGAGSIMRQEGYVAGLTTAASIWMVAAIGTAVGVHAYGLAVTGTVFALVVLEGYRWAERFLSPSADHD